MALHRIEISFEEFQMVSSIKFWNNPLSEGKNQNASTVTKPACPFADIKYHGYGKIVRHSLVLMRKIEILTSLLLGRVQLS